MQQLAELFNMCSYFNYTIIYTKKLSKILLVFEPNEQDLV